MEDDKGALFSGDWRDAGPSRPAIPKQRVAFGTASELHLRSRPASHAEELSRARSVVSAGSAAVANTMAVVRSGDRPPINELVEIVDGVTASLMRDALALPSITRLRQQHEYTYIHSVAVCGWMVALAQELQLAPEEIRDAGLAGLLHDVGKAMLPPELLDRPGHYTNAESALLREHPLRGYEALRDVPEMPASALDAVLHHHERLDGSGFPDGLSGGALGLFVRMAAVCNFYDNMTCPPLGADKWSSSQALDFLREARVEFDEGVVRAFVRVVGAFPPGALVRLRSDRLAVVLDEAERDPLHPVVAVFRHVGGGAISPQRMSTKADPIIGIERPENWPFADWPALRRELLDLAQ